MLCHVTSFTICPRLVVAFTCTSLPLNLYTSVFECGWGSDLNKSFGGSTDLAKKGHGLAELDAPIHPPPYQTLYVSTVCKCSYFARAVPFYIHIPPYTPINDIF